ncbi:MarR family transcriptional regulator [Sphingomonas sp. BIUV-7]|uniref:MarR family transcriptional regulator n=1 Tax=Sphingomonas natans TaxID=3063330 RepID=A0ABT8YBQ5_9SPHN|nr:MarR family transcriptional regulator [Sphingomonas sp. BIUV-7]MDO6415763.1 MarR family transcriptional regulator [Sphingomonas sp. BIUV-7]
MLMLAPRSTCACTALRKASRAISRAYDEALVGEGITTNQFSLLRTLARHGATPLSRLADRMVMERTSLYRMLAPLETRGLVSVAEGPGKARIADLTDAGRAALASADDAWSAAQARFVGALGAAEWTQLEALLTRATRIAEEIAA